MGKPCLLLSYTASSLKRDGMTSYELSIDEEKGRCLFLSLYSIAIFPYTKKQASLEEQLATEVEAKLGYQLFSTTNRFFQEEAK